MKLPSSSLSDRQLAVLQAVEHHTQITASQVRRLLYAKTEDGKDKTPKGQENTSRDHLKRLSVELKLIRRVWGVYPITGVAQFIYMPIDKTAEGPAQHTLDITELYVRLSEAGNIYPASEHTETIYMGERVLSGELNESVEVSLQPAADVTILAFDREPWCHVQVGQMEIKPDAFCRIRVERGVRQVFVEVDRGKEHKAQLAKQMRAYTRAFEAWDHEKDGPTFPHVIWTVPDKERKRVLESVIKKMTYPQLFTVCLFDDFVATVQEGQS